MSTDTEDSGPFAKSEATTLRALVRDLMSVVNLQLDQLDTAAIESIKRSKEVVTLHERISDLSSSLRFLASAQLTGETAGELRSSIRKEVSRVFTLPDEGSA